MDMNKNDFEKIINYITKISLKHDKKHIETKIKLLKDDFNLMNTTINNIKILFISEAEYYKNEYDECEYDDDNDNDDNDYYSSEMLKILENRLAVINRQLDEYNKIMKSILEKEEIISLLKEKIL
jgi:hypothetical protein